MNESPLALNPDLVYSLYANGWKPQLLSWAERGGAAHSFTDYRIRLEDVGFKQVKQLGEHWLSAIK